MNIREVLARRTDLSTFVVHLTRSNGSTAAKNNLLSILTSKEIEAKSSFGQACQRVKRHFKNACPERDAAMNSQRVVCFTETPLEHLYLLTENIESRDFQLCPYGIALPKIVARSHGLNPVWYIDITPGHDWLTKPLNALIDEALANGPFQKSHAAELAPFVEQMGHDNGNYCKEFWWEREWRCRGNFRLPRQFIGLCPSGEISSFRQASENAGYQVPWIAPEWGLEEIIARLAGFEAGEIVVPNPPA